MGVWGPREHRRLNMGGALPTVERAKVGWQRLIMARAATALGVLLESWVPTGRVVVTALWAGLHGSVYGVEAVLF